VDLDDPLHSALLCVEAFDRAGLPYALCGGLALAAYGVPRETKDVDFAVVDLSAERAGAALAAIGVSVNVAFERIVFGGLAVGRVTLLGDRTSSGLNVLDLVRPRSARYATALLARAVHAPLRGRPIRVASPEDFVLLKLLASRERDLEDTRSVLTRLGDALDRELVARELGLLAREIADWDVRGRWDQVARGA
jgi:hypothetical protein